MEFGGSAQKTQAIRRIYGIMEFLSDLGGLFGTLFLIGYLYSFVYSRHLNKFYFAENHFKTSKHPTDDDESNSKKSSRKLWWDSLEYLKLSPLDKLRNTMICCCSISKKDRLLDQADKKVERHLDVAR